MKDVYEPELDARIKDFLDRKSRKYPELRLFDGVKPINTETTHRAAHRPPQVVLHEL